MSQLMNHALTENELLDLVEELTAEAVAEPGPPRALTRLQRRTGASEEQILAALRALPPQRYSVCLPEDLADLQRAVADAADSAAPVADDERVDAEVLRAARRGTPWAPIAIVLGTLNFRAVHERFERRVREAIAHDGMTDEEMLRRFENVPVENPRPVTEKYGPPV